VWQKKFKYNYGKVWHIVSSQFVASYNRGGGSNYSLRNYIMLQRRSIRNRTWTFLFLTFFLNHIFKNKPTQFLFVSYSFDCCQHIWHGKITVARYILGWQGVRRERSIDTYSMWKLVVSLPFRESSVLPYYADGWNKTTLSPPQTRTSLSVQNPPSLPDFEPAVMWGSHRCR
jgi:hypothetical protein